MEELTINGKEYVLKSEQKNLDGDIKIVILQRGWVMVGYFSKIESQCYLKNAAVIRSWGTTKGLGEIALNGPIKDKTILDMCGLVEFHELTTVAILSTNQEKWKESLK